jgi:hypothetical protein
MDPLAEFTKLECWDNEGKPYLKEVSTGFWQTSSPIEMDT